MVNTFVFMGRPGSGKGKQSEMLAEKTGFTIYSTGSELRKISKEDSPLGKKIAQEMNSGGLMPAWLATYLFQKTLINSSLETGLIFEGVGRKLEEAKLFPEVCDWVGRDFRILHLNVSDQTARDRLNKRRETESRKDDQPDVLDERFRNFYKDTEPALDYFRSIGKVIEIDGEPLPDIVAAEVWQKISNL